MGRTSTATAARPRDAETKLARSRLSVLELEDQPNSSSGSLTDVAGIGQLAPPISGRNFVPQKFLWQHQFSVRKV